MRPGVSPFVALAAVGGCQRCCCGAQEEVQQHSAAECSDTPQPLPEEEQHDAETRQGACGVLQPDDETVAKQGADVGGALRAKIPKFPPPQKIGRFFAWGGAFFRIGAAETKRPATFPAAGRGASACAARSYSSMKSTFTCRWKASCNEM